MTDVAIILLCMFPFDLVFNAAAGVAAAGTGAHVEHAVTTAHILRIGAISALMKSAILNVSTFVMSFTHNWLLAIFIWIFAASNFGLALVITLNVSQQVLGSSKLVLFANLVSSELIFFLADDRLLIAAVAAAVPLLAGTGINAAYPHCMSRVNTDSSKLFRED